MIDAFYYELRKANNDISIILNGDDIEEKKSSMNIIEDAIDMLQTISIVAMQDSFLDVFVKICDYKGRQGYKDFEEVVGLYAQSVEHERLNGAKDISDDRLMEIFLLKFFTADRSPALQLSLLIYFIGLISLKNREGLQERHEKLMTMIPDVISADYLNGMHFKVLMDFENERIDDRLQSLSYGNEISIPPQSEAFNLTRFVDEAVKKMTIGETKELIEGMSDYDLVNTMDVISGISRKKLFDNMEHEKAAHLSQKVFIFSVILDAEKDNICSRDEMQMDFRSRILPSIRKAVAIVIMATGNRFDYRRREHDGKDKKRVTGNGKRAKKDK
ncbi:hypothetical protein [Butyrivibrio sp. VCB2001]|uniref:hypothetical protein n=1 Tax=Butyrivibrio sp. VCB2001 TaxID=1280667 RepID=UPI00047E058C|nr:hypothetical protein [Butyrivibrio sp. VCB2001]